jgi:hypothetical protein
MTEGSLLWRLLGRREAFAMVAARCSAAEAADLKELRDSKAYLEVAADWKEFVPKHLKMSYDSANRIIRNLEEFGPVYFDVAQFTRISPEAYRAIAPSISDQGLNSNGEVIALIPENAERVAAAVTEMRKAAPVRAKKKAEPPAVKPPFVIANEACEVFLGNLEDAVDDGEDRAQVSNLIAYMRDLLDEIEAKM